MNDQILENNQEPSNSHFEQLVGEGKKFKDQEALAKAKMDSDTYVKTLEQKLDNAVADIESLRKANNSQANMQELIETFRSMQTKGDNTQQLQSPQNTQSSFDPKSITNLVADQVKQLETEKAEKANLAQVQNKIKEKWGDNVPASVREQINKLGDLGALMAKRHPDEFLRTIGAETVNRQPGFQTPPRGSVNSDNFKSQTTTDRTWSWWEDFRKKSPTEYYSRKNTVMMHNDAQRLGDRFMDGDFGADDKELLTTKYNSPF